MASSYPAALDTATQQPSPTATTEMDDTGYEHHTVHQNASEALIALEGKLGVGATTAAGASTGQVLVKQADGDTEWAAASTPTAITVADTTDTTCSVALFESATGDLAPKTDGGATYNAGTGTLTATAFAGPLTGNVTGNASGTAATVTGAAQTAITSVGTLTDLTVSGTTTTYVDVIQETGATHTFALTDAGKYIHCTGAAGAITITLPSDATLAFPIGTQMLFSSVHASNQITFAAGSSAAVTSLDDKLALKGPDGVAAVLKWTTNSWLLFGALE